MILVGDYSNGNDMVVAAPGIQSVGDLKADESALKSGLSVTFCCWMLWKVPVSQKPMLS